jgi:hypothetical protein
MNILVGSVIDALRQFNKQNCKAFKAESDEKEPVFLPKVNPISQDSYSDKKDTISLASSAAALKDFSLEIPNPYRKH